MLLLLALMLSGGPAVAAVFNVSPGSDLQTTIGAAGANADASNTILFAPGVYNLSFQLMVGSGFSGRTLTLQGSQGAAATILDGGDANRILQVRASASGAHVVIEGLTLRNGWAQGSSGGAVESSLTEITVRDSMLVGNRADLQGGALSVSGSVDLSQRNILLLHVEGTSFDNNVADGSGGAVYVQHTSAEVQGSSFDNNEAAGIANGLLSSPRGSGGAIYVFTGAVDIDASSFTANISNWAGGALRAAQADASVSGSNFDGNSAVRNVAGDPTNNGDGGAVQVQTVDEVHSFTFEDNIFQNNVAGGLGGAIHAFVGTTASTIELKGNRFESNTASHSGGIAIDGCFVPSAFCPVGQLGAAAVTFENNKLIENSSSLFFGAGSVSGVAELNFQGNEVRGNTTTGDFAGLQFRDIACTLVSQNRFLGNINPPTSLNLDGALSLFSLRPCPVSPRSAVVENNFFSGNQGHFTGALAISQSGRIDVVGNTFSDNRVADAFGAAVWVLSEAKFANNLFSGSDPAVTDRFGLRPHQSGISLEVNQNGFFENELGLVFDPLGVLGSDVTYSTAAQLNTSASASLNVEVDPVFVDAANGNLHLQPTSIAIGEADCDLFSVPTSDVDGDSRPGPSGDCDLGADERTVHQLTVTKSGGSGTVTSVPAGIDCGGDCDEIYSSDTVVTLSAAPTGDFEFDSWNGGPDCADGEVRMSAPRTCEAVFRLKPLLTVSKAGSGSGRVISAPAGVDCGLDCDQRFDSGTSVDLTVMPDGGSLFTGWSGHPDCADATVLMTGDVTCTAILSLLRTLEVTKSGTGTGTVTSAPVGISCGADCTEVYPEATVVALTAVPDMGSEFGGWSGLGCVNGTVSLISDVSCSAAFNPCSDPSVVSLPSQTVTTTATFEACNRLIAGAEGLFAVAGSGGDVTFRSGNSIELENGFSVGPNATFRAVIGPP